MEAKRRKMWSSLVALIVPLTLATTLASEVAAEGPPGEVFPAQGQMPERSGVVVHRPFAPSGPAREPTVAIDNSAVSDHGAPQNETAIAADPTNDQRLVGSANDYRLGDTSCGIYNTIDGGSNWSAGVLGRPNIGATGEFYEAGGDPSVAVGPDGVAHVGCLYFTRDFLAPNAVVVHTEDNAGNFSSTKVVEFTDVTVEDGKPYLFHDKPYIAVDTSGGAHDGNVYVSWTIFSGHQEIVFPFLNLVFDEARIHFSRLIAGGTSFSAPDPLSGFVAQGSVPAVGPGGEVYVVWQKFPENGGDDFDILLKKSTDGGENFDGWLPTGPELVTVVDGYTPIPSPLPNANYRVNSFPSIAVDTSGGAHDGNVYVVYAAQDVANNDAGNIYLKYSINGGETWNDPIQVNGDTTTNAQFFPWVSVGPDGKVNVVWYDRADDPNDEAIHLYADYSEDGGSSFEGNIRVSDFDFTPNNRDQFGGAFIGDYNGVASAADTILPLWTTLVVSGRGRNKVQDYEAFFDSVDTSSPPPIGGSGNMHIGDLDGSSRSQGSRWRVTVTGTVHNDGHGPVADATVRGHWNGEAANSASCTTGADGQCNVSLRRIDSSESNVSFTVDDVSGTLTYHQPDNHDPDGDDDSDGTVITVDSP